MLRFYGKLCYCLDCGKDCINFVVFPDLVLQQVLVVVFFLVPAPPMPPSCFSVALGGTYICFKGERSDAKYLMTNSGIDVDCYGYRLKGGFDKKKSTGF